MKSPFDVPDLIHDAGNFCLLRWARTRYGGGVSGWAIMFVVGSMSWAKWRDPVGKRLRQAVEYDRVDIERCIYAVRVSFGHRVVDD